MFESKSVSGAILAIATLLLAQLGCAETYVPMEHRKLAHDGVEREYFVHVPDNATGPLPVVFAIHGYSSTATGFQAAHDLNHHADQNGYMVVYPQGTHWVVELDGGASFRPTTWNTFGEGEPKPDAGPMCTPDATAYACPPGCGVCGPCHWAPCTDDPGLFDKLLDAVEAEFETDNGRFYALGVSNGGMMVLRIGCDMSDRFAAVAPIVALLPTEHSCAPEHDLPIMFLAGGMDETIRIDGLPGRDDPFMYTPLVDSAKEWAAAMQCEIGPEPWQNDLSNKAGLTCNAYSSCRVAGQEVVSCVDEDGGHRWPAQRPTGPSATCVTPEQYESMPGQSHCETRAESGDHTGMDLVWQFFSQYSR